MKALDNDKACAQICPFMSQFIIDLDGNSQFAAVSCRSTECIAWETLPPLHEAGKCLLVSK